MESFVKNFWKKVEFIPEHPCWEWTGAKIKGHGQFRVGNKRTPAHRFSWELHNDKIPIGMHCLHKCDNRGCVNPGHLFIGTNKDNVIDKINKNRQFKKLTKEQAVEIKNLKGQGLTLAKIASFYKISISAVWKIQTGLNWKHVVAPK